MLTRDEKLHLILGFVIVAYLGGLYLLQRYIGPGLTLALGSIVAAGGVEVYQHVRKEGYADFLDALISAMPGMLAGLVWWSLE